MSKTFVETSTYLLEEIDEMVREGFYHNRTEAVNDALRMLLRQYKLSKLHDKDLHKQEERKQGSESR